MIARTTPKIAYLLAYAGLLPFLACAVLVWFDEPFEVFFIFHVFYVYSFLILAFLCGSWWGFALAGLSGAAGQGLLIGSNLLLLALWLLLVFMQNQWSVALLGLGYALVYAGECLFRELPVDRGYRQMRLLLTTLVLLCHVSVFYAMS